MPYNPHLKSGAGRNRPKPQYKVINWREYNKSLKKRGRLRAYLPNGNLKEILFNSESYIEGVSGRSNVYTPAYIELAYTYYRLFSNMGLRQVTGLLEDLWAQMEMDIPVPSFGTLSDAFASLSIEIQHFCDNVARRLIKGENIALIIDSTGMRFPKAQDWHENKYANRSVKRPTRKMHVSIDLDMDTHIVEVTEGKESDIAQMDNMIPAEIRQLLNEIFADGAYYDHQRAQALVDDGIIPVIPPPKTAVVHGRSQTRWHDFLLSYIQRKGFIYAFYQKFNYGLRERIEAHFSRITRCLGNSFKTIKLESQKTEAVIISNILNFWNSFGRPVTVKIG